MRGRQKQAIGVVDHHVCVSETARDFTQRQGFRQSVASPVVVALGRQNAQSVMAYDRGGERWGNSVVPSSDSPPLRDVVGLHTFPVKEVH
jgi:hypothetical protein